MEQIGVPPIFYTNLAEGSKILFYLLLTGMIILGLIQRRRGLTHWAIWIHIAIMLNFVVGIAYSGIRMITTDETTDMLIRRIFAWEAWFNLACAAFYFLGWWIWEEYKILRLGGQVRDFKRQD